MNKIIFEYTDLNEEYALESAWAEKKADFYELRNILSYACGYSFGDYLTFNHQSEMLVMKYLSTILIFMLPLLGSAQSGQIPKNEDTLCLKKYDPKLKKDVYSFVDERPEFPGGFEAFRRYVLKNKPAYDEENIQYTLMFEFVIDVDGSIIDEKIPGKEINDYTAWDKGVLRMVQGMPKWRPGKCKSRKVPVRLSFRFSLHPSY